MTTPIAGVGLGSDVTGYAPMAGTTGTSDTTGTTGTTDTPSTSGTSSSSTSLLDPQAFLQLLVAQLKYQDPSNPVDTASFMNQTAMLSQVQTMSSMSDTLSALADAQQAQAATGLIGKQVTYLDDKGMRVSGIASSAELLASGATLQVDGVTVPLSSVVEVTTPPATTTTTTP
jgi:flagellar basal-body rod modification protein FlgD